ncbi:MAG: GGDEF domain-containing protein [Polyangiaceae bacterium]|nr:GGDEF domain-containing protein [Polyangiaceae bacterium]
MSSDDRDQRATIVTAQVAPYVPPTAGSTQACLVVIYGAELGKRVPLGFEPVELGRSPDVAVSFDDDAASRKHARIRRHADTFVITDLGSTNGTYVNDTLIHERPMVDGDQIKVGRTIFKFIQGSDLELLYHEQIYRVMTYDGLTQVVNRRTFDATLEREISRSRRYGRILTLIVFDIDHFKRINDAHGHVAGDYILRQVAGVVSQNVRREDTVARTGGEEFAVLAPEIVLSNAAGVTEKLRILIEAQQCRFEGNIIPVTASFGVASFSGEPEMGAAQLYQVADERLYTAKRSGRNRVIWA